MKKRIFVFICAVVAIAMLMLSSCSIIGDLRNAVEYPSVYTLSYVVTTSDGSIYTVTKTVDNNGSVYYKDLDTEKLYINDNGSYTLYERNEEGTFVASGEEKYTKKVVDEETSGISEFAEASKMKLMPTAKNEGMETVVGRSCDVYKLGVGNDDNGAYYYYYVDAETGICLQLEARHSALGQDVTVDSDTFICTEFITENVEDLYV